MNQADENERDPFELPKPQLSAESKEVSPGIEQPNINELVSSKAVEQGQHQMPATAQPVQDATAQPQHLPVQQVAHVPTTLSAADDTGLPLVANDHDLIEKEWVIKAKDIVNRTKNDPHARSGQMSKVKVGYVKKRFDKDIKLSET